MILPLTKVIGRKQTCIAILTIHSTHLYQRTFEAVGTIVSVSNVINGYLGLSTRFWDSRTVEKTRHYIGS